MASTQSSARRNARGDERKNLIIGAVKDLELTEFSCWSDLDALSTRTIQEDIEILDEVLEIENDHFKGMLNIYVMLEYGKGEDGFVTSDGFPGKFRGHFDEDGKPVIDDVIVDTSSFYD